MINLSVKPSDFGAAYIQTLPHARKEEEFENREEYIEYLDLRQETYFREFMRATMFCHDELQQYTSDDAEDK